MKKVLLIEDDEGLNESTSLFLRISKFEVISAQDGAEGIHKAILEHPDIVICDISMPGLDGFEVYKALQSNLETSTIPFIFLTAKAETEDLRNGMLIGADDYITKPCKFDDLLLSINTRIHKKEKRSLLNDESFNVLLQNSSNGVLICNSDFEIIRSNKKFSEMTLYSEYEITGHKINEILNGENFAIDNKLSLCLKGVQNLKFNSSILTKKKEKIAITTTANSTKIDGKTVIMIGTVKKQSKTKNSDLSNAVHLLSNNKERISPELLNELKVIFNTNQPKPQNKTQLKLTRRQTEILTLVCKGLSNNEIAEKLFISYRTVERHRTNIINKTNSKNIIDVIIFAIKNNLIEV